MKTTTKLYKRFEIKTLISAAVALAFATPLVTADDEYEWDPTWGYHEEEWYDPSDWFNDDGAVEYEELDEYGTDYWGADYGDAYTNDTWYDTYDYQDTGYTWNAEEQAWNNGNQQDAVSYVIYTVAVTPEEQQRQQQNMERNERGQQGRQEQAAQNQRDRQDRQEQARQERDRDDKRQAKQQREEQEKRAARAERQKAEKEALAEEQEEQAKNERQKEAKQQREAREQQKRDKEQREARAEQKRNEKQAAARAEEKRDKKQAQREDDQMKGRPLAQTTVSGTIDGFRKMNLQQTPESKPIEQTLARVNLENGNTWIVALGDKKVMRKMKPESGDDIEVSGVRAMIDGQPAIIASSITIDGETMKIDREAAENIAFTGTIEDYGKARLSGKKKPEHLVVSLMLEDGSDRGIVVDFGPKTNMKDLKLESGNQITVVGRKAQIGEKSVLVAQQYKINE